MSSDSLTVDMQSLRGELFRAHRTAQLGAVTSLIAHEFNNLMTPVLARAHDAVKRNDPQAMHKALSVTITQTTRALEITRRLLELSAGGDCPRREPCSVAQAVKHALDSAVRPLAKDAIAVSLEIADGLLVGAEPTLLEQSLLNLVLHARGAMGDCGGGRLRVRASADGDMARIDVAHLHGRGAGAPGDRAAAASRDPGLSVVQLIVDSHGGEYGATIEAGEVVHSIRWPLA